jgi:multicomponent Na+:H+ antiporter subunit G
VSGVLDIVSWAAIVGGSIFALVAGIGLLRLPDFFSRVHATGIQDTLATGLIIFGLLLQTDDWLVAVKLVLVFIFVLITGPTATHALARAALHAGFKPPLDSEAKSSSN